MDEGVTLKNLPVLVRFNPSEMTFGRTDHADLAFSQVLGDKEVALSYEVDTWTENSALVWVRLRSAARAATFRMYWGADVDIATDFRYTWPDYVCVIHFNGDKTDSAKYACVGSSLGTGLIGGGVTGPKTKALRPFGGLANQSQFAVSAWVHPTANSSAVRILSMKATYGDDGMELIYVKDAGIYLRGNKSDAQVVYKDGNDTVFPKNTWTHYLAVCTNSSGQIYKNGQAMSVTGSINASTPSGKDLMMGGYNGNDTSGNLSGAMDELRVYNGVPSAERVKAEYQAMADENFLTTDVIPSTVEVASMVSARDESRLAISGNVLLGENEDKVTVVINVGASAEVVDKTYEIADCVTGPFNYEITDLQAGRYYISVGLKDVDGSFSTPVLQRVGVLPPLEWTGYGNGTSWTDADNWSSRTVPQADDSVIFGGFVNADKTIVAGSGEAKAKKVTITTPYALRFENISVLDVVIADTAAEETIFSPLTIDLMDGTDVATWTVPAGKKLKIGNFKGRASLLKLGAGEATLAGTDCDRAVGTTDVREGTLVFCANRQLGTGLSVGGSVIPAVARAAASNVSASEFNPFDATRRSVHVLTNGFVDLASDGANGQWWVGNNVSGSIVIDAGGKFDLGNRRLGYQGDGISVSVGGEFLYGANAPQLVMERTTFVMTETAKPLSLDQSVSVQFQYAPSAEGGYDFGAFDVADNPDASVELTINGRISAGWAARDGIEKLGAGVLRLTNANTYGGGNESDNAGRTRVKGGTLLVDNTTGSGTGASRVHVAKGATVGGVGTIGGVTTEKDATGEYARLVAAGDTTAQAVIAPGTIDDATGAHVCGTLTVGSVEIPNPAIFGDYSTLRIRAGLRGDPDALVVNGAVSVSAVGTRLELGPAVEGGKVRGGTSTILSATEGITGDFAEIVVPRSSWKVSKVNARQVDGGGGTLVEVYDALVVAMPGVGLAVIVR